MPVYKFEDMVIDPQKYPWGYIAGLLYFNGATSYVETEYLERMDAYVFSGDVYYDADTAPNRYAIIDTRRTDTTTSIWHFLNLEVNDGKLRTYYVNTSNSIAYLVDPSNLPLKSWEKVGVERDGSNIGLIRAGSVVASADNSRVATYYDAQHSLVFGVYRGLGNRLWEGYLRNFSIQTAEAKSAFWPMNEGKGPLVFDGQNDFYGVLIDAEWRTSI